MKRAACPEEDHFPKRHRQDSPATRFPVSPILDAPTLTSLQAAVIPGATMPAANLAVIGTMLNVTVAETKRQVDATAKPSRDSMIVGMCLDYELNGEDRFVEKYDDAPSWIEQIELDNVSVAYLESTVSPGWHTSDQDYYPRKRAFRVINTVFHARVEALGLSEREIARITTSGLAKWFKKYASVSGGVNFNIMSWEGLEEFRVACVEDLRAFTKYPAGDGSDVYD
jgi:hypothetical protein